MIPLMVAVISKPFCSQRVAGYVTRKVAEIWETVCGFGKPFAVLTGRSCRNTRNFIFARFQEIALRRQGPVVFVPYNTEMPSI